MLGQVLPVFGKAFIADGRVWSAAHIFMAGLPQKDCIDLGVSPIPGLTICKEEHRKGDFFFYKTTKRGKITMVVLEDREHSFFVTLSETMLHGDSGSPVLCQEHKNVVGVVSYMWIKHKDINLAGGIAKLPEIEAKEED